MRLTAFHTAGVTFPLQGAARFLVFALLSLAGTLQTAAQERHELNRRIDSVLEARYWRADIDTNYVFRPRTKWTLKGQLKVSGARIATEGRENGHLFKTKLTAEHKSTISIGASYRGLALSLALNPAKLMGKYHDYELNFRSYGRRFGFDIAYQDAHNFDGWLDEEGVGRTKLPDDLLKLRTLNVNAYYVFNNRRFSYPAALGHSYIQRRSAGSFLLAASGQGQHGKVEGEDLSLNFKMTNIGIGAGYGYNFVPARTWLLHLSSLPTFIIYSHTSLTMNGTRIPLRYHFPEVIITGRGAVVKQIGRNKFAGLSMIYNFTNVGKKNNLSVYNEKWLVCAYFGLRL